MTTQEETPFASYGSLPYQSTQSIQASDGKSTRIAVLRQQLQACQSQLYGLHCQVQGLFFQVENVQQCVNTTVSLLEELESGSNKVEVTENSQPEEKKIITESEPVQTKPDQESDQKTVPEPTPEPVPEPKPVVSRAEKKVKPLDMSKMGSWADAMDTPSPTPPSTVRMPRMTLEEEKAKLQDELWETEDRTCACHCHGRCKCRCPPGKRYERFDGSLCKCPHHLKSCTQCQCPDKRKPRMRKRKIKIRPEVLERLNEIQAEEENLKRMGDRKEWPAPRKEVVQEKPKTVVSHSKVTVVQRSYAAILKRAPTPPSESDGSDGNEESPKELTLSRSFTTKRSVLNWADMEDSD
jgi:hypothetical protein